MTAQVMSATGNITEYVTTMIGGQLFGLPIGRVQDVFMPERLTRVPLAGADVEGVLNLRGRIVTAINMRWRLDAVDDRDRLRKRPERPRKRQRKGGVGDEDLLGCRRFERDPEGRTPNT